MSEMTKMSSVWIARRGRRGMVPFRIRVEEWEYQANDALASRGNPNDGGAEGRSGWIADRGILVGSWINLRTTGRSFEVGIILWWWMSFLLWLLASRSDRARAWATSRWRRLPEVTYHCPDLTHDQIREISSGRYRRRRMLADDLLLQLGECLAGRLTAESKMWSLIDEHRELTEASVLARLHVIAQEPERDRHEEDLRLDVLIEKMFMRLSLCFLSDGAAGDLPTDAEMRTYMDEYRSLGGAP